MFTQSHKLFARSGFQAKRFFGNFELHAEIPPRYFVLTYQMKKSVYEAKLDESKDIGIEHSDRVERAIASQRLMFRGEVKPEEETDNLEMFFLFKGKDERDPFNFMKADPLYQQDFLQKWEIKELDLLHKERDDELMISSKYN